MHQSTFLSQEIVSSLLKLIERNRELIIEKSPGKKRERCMLYRPLWYLYCCSETISGFLPPCTQAYTSWFLMVHGGHVVYCSQWVMSRSDTCYHQVRKFNGQGGSLQCHLWFFGDYLLLKMAAVHSLYIPEWRGMEQNPQTTHDGETQEINFCC
jgi:hypothetical protein